MDQQGRFFERKKITENLHSDLPAGDVVARPGSLIGQEPNILNGKLHYRTHKEPARTGYPESQWCSRTTG